MSSPAACRRRLVAAILAAGLVAAAGCGDGDRTADTVAAPGPATDATAAPGPDATDPDAPNPSDPAEVVATTGTDATPPPATDRPSSTDAPGAEPAVTTVGGGSGSPPSDPAPEAFVLWSGTESMTAAWDSANATLNGDDPAAVPRFELTVDDLQVAPLASGGDGFGVVDLFAAGFLSGTIDPGGEISSMIATLDPADESAVPALRSTLLALAATPPVSAVAGDAFGDAVEAAYGELADPSTALGEQRFVTVGGSSAYAAALTVIEDAAATGTVVEVAVIPIIDEEVALSIVELLRFELLTVTGG